MTENRLAVPRRVSVRSLTVGLCLALLSGCGLGIDNAERLARAQAAYDRAEYRSAIIDTKAILQQEPDNPDARLLLGRASLRTADAASAEKELRRAMDLGVSFEAVAVDLGRAMLALRQFEELLDQIEPARATTADERFAMLKLHGEALMALARPTVARSVYQEVLAESPRDIEARLGVVSSYVADGEYATARKLTDEALTVDPEYAPAWLASGSLYMTDRQAGAAAEAFALALKLARQQSDTDGQARALGSLTEARLAQENLVAAKDALKELEALKPNEPVTRYLAARVAYQDGDFVLAQSELQEVVKAAPAAPQVQLLLGAVNLKLGKLGQAEMYLSAVVYVLPDSTEARKLLAETRLQQRRADEAAEILRPALASAALDNGTLNLMIRAGLDTGDYSDGIAYLRRALAMDPDSESIPLDLAAALIASGEVGEAEALLTASGSSDRTDYRRELLSVIAPLRRGDSAAAMQGAAAMAERWPDDARVHSLMGGMAAAAGEFDVARRHYLEARRIDPSDIGSYVNVAAIDVQRGEYESARQQYREALGQQPGSADLMLAMARLEAQAKENDAALEWVEKARQVNSTAIIPRIHLAYHYLETSAYAAAAEVSTEIIQIDSGHAEAHNLLGRAQLGLGEHAAALKSFEQAALSDPASQEYRVNQIRAHAALGNYREAEQALLGYGSVNLDDIRLSAMLAELKVAQGNLAAATRIARDLQVRHPNDGFPYALEARLLADAQQYEQAADLYAQALSMRQDDRRLAIQAFRARAAGNLKDPERPLVDYLQRQPLDHDVRMVLAQGYDSTGDVAAAIREYEQVLETAPDNVTALNNLAWAYHQNRDSRAETIAEQAFSLAPRSGAVADTLGWIQVNQGKVDEGISTLVQAVKLSDGEAEIKYHLAAALAAAGEKSAARMALEEAIASGEGGFPSRGDAEQLLESL